LVWIGLEESKLDAVRVAEWDAAVVACRRREVVIV
jgi:hypothetical protein